jgi:hypothetical protein
MARIKDRHEEMGTATNSNAVIETGRLISPAPGAGGF